MLSLSKDLEKNTIAWKLFTGTVIVNNDPVKIQRIKVRCEVLHDGIADADLPWAIPVFGNTAFAPKSDGTGDSVIISVPPIGTSVWITFLDNSLYNPIYLGAALLPSNINNALLGGNYPNRWGVSDKNGNKFMVDTTNNSLIWEMASGFKFEVTTSAPNTTENIEAKCNAPLYLDFPEVHFHAIGEPCNSNCYIAP